MLISSPTTPRRMRRSASPSARSTSTSHFSSRGPVWRRHSTSPSRTPMSRALSAWVSSSTSSCNANPGTFDDERWTPLAQPLLHTLAVLLLRGGHRHLRGQSVHEHRRIPHAPRRIRHSRSSSPTCSQHSTRRMRRTSRSHLAALPVRQRPAVCDQVMDQVVPRFTKKAREELINPAISSGARSTLTSSARCSRPSSRPATQ